MDIKRKNILAVLVMQAFNSSTLEAEAEGSL